jgi:hypothetical protein
MNKTRRIHTFCDAIGTQLLGDSIHQNDGATEWIVNCTDVIKMIKSIKNHCEWKTLNKPEQSNRHFKTELFRISNHGHKPNILGIDEILRLRVRHGGGRVNDGFVEARADNLGIRGDLPEHREGQTIHVGDQRTHVCR